MRSPHSAFQCVRSRFTTGAITLGVSPSKSERGVGPEDVERHAAGSEARVALMEAALQPGGDLKGVPAGDVEHDGQRAGDAGTHRLAQLEIHRAAALFVDEPAAAVGAPLVTFRRVLGGGGEGVLEPLEPLTEHAASLSPAGERVGERGVAFVLQRLETSADLGHGFRSLAGPSAGRD